MSDLKQRIESMYRSDVRGSLLFVILLWVAVLFVLYMTWPIIHTVQIKWIVAVSAGAVLIFNTASMLAMVRNYARDKEFIYRLDIENLDAVRRRKL